MKLICEGTPAPVDIIVNGIDNKELSKIADECSSEDRIKIAKAALHRWNLMHMIEKAKVSYNFMIVLTIIIMMFCFYNDLLF